MRFERIAVGRKVNGAQREQPLQFDLAQMRRSFDREPFLIAHGLTEHPLFELSRLVELSRRLPAESVEYNAGDLPIDQAPALTPRTGLSIEQTLVDIETCHSWMALKNVEQDELYRQILDDCLDQIAPVIESISPRMVARKAFIFVSSPGAVTPYHVDFEYNFLLQIRGAKIVTVFDGQDRSLLSEPDRERAVGGAPRNLGYREEFSKKGRAFSLSPGVGLHVPLTSPHWVKVEDNVSVSLSITFQSAASDRIIGAHATNALLRRIGIRPRQVGESATTDGLKFAAHRVLRRLSTTMQRFRKCGGGTERPIEAGY